jgi:hypothetical protein
VAEKISPIIIGGCHRSGTSLIRRILNAHSQIYCGPEVKFFRDFYSDYPRDPLKHLRFIHSARYLLPEDDLFDVLGRAFVVLHQRAATRAGKSRWADKNPENVLFLSDWHRLLGNDWYFVHVVRNPFDTIASMKEARFPFTIPSDFDARIAFYRRYTEAGLDFGAAHPERYFRVIYEHLVRQPETVISQLMKYLDDRFESQQIAFHEEAHQKGLEDPKIADTNSIHSESVGRWRTLLNTEEIQRIRQKCIDLWRQIDPDENYMD